MSSTRPDPVLASWPVVSEEELGRYSIFSLSRRVLRSPTNGSDHTSFRLQAPDWVNMVALTTEGQLLLVEQYRYGTEQVTLEIPGGAVDEGEEAAAAAARELEEETGYRPGRLHLIGEVEPNPAFLDNRCFTFLALDCVPGPGAEPDLSEEIVVRTVPLAAFTGLIDDGSIRHSLVIAAHDHLQRGIRAGAAWASELPAEAKE